MGGRLEKEQINQLRHLRDRSVSDFTEIEIKKIHKRFLVLGQTNPGFLNQEEMRMIPELTLNPMCHRVMNLLDQNANNAISFEDFIRTLWVFSPKAPNSLKIKTFYKVFDINADGKISETDLFFIMQVMVGKQYPSDKPLEIVKNIIQKAQMLQNQEERREYLTFEELTKYFAQKEIIDAMTSAFSFTQ